MKKLCLFAALAGLGLAASAPPTAGTSASATAAGGYPPCSRTVTDRCIQLYERGVNTRANLAMNARLGPGRVPRQVTAQGGPYEAPPVTKVGTWRELRSSTAYPTCSATITDRCVQRSKRGPRRARR
jgi:hypothetical protein